jgi:hypothetical protein
MALAALASLAGMVAAVPAATVFAAPLAQATATPSITTLRGVLENGGLGCPPAGLHVTPCDGGPAVAVYMAPGVIDPLPYLGAEVELKGVMRTCQAGSGSYLDLSSISRRDCGAQSPTPTPPGPLNLALGAAVTASSDVVPGHAPNLLTDGDPATEWRVPPGRAAWAYVDLGRTGVFNELVMRWGTDYAVEYAVYVWDDMLGEDGDWLRLAYRPDGRGGEERLALPRAEGRFLLLHLVRANRPDGGFDLAEWEVYGQKTPNLALGCTARPPLDVGFQPGRDPWRAIDGDLGTSWASQPGERHPHLVITCDQPVRLAEIRIHWDDAAFAQFYRVQFYKGLGILPRGFGIENNDGGRDKISWLDPVEADGVLVYIDAIQPGADHVSISELELYGLGAGDDDALTVDAPSVAGARRLGYLPEPLDLRPLVSGAELDWWVADGFGEGFASPLAPRDARLGPLPGDASTD